MLRKEERIRIEIRVILNYINNIRIRMRMKEDVREKERAYKKE